MFHQTGLVWLLVAVALCGMSPAVLDAQPCDPHWDDEVGQPGTDGAVLALAAYDDGGGAALYAGGFFSDAGGVSVSNIAKWDGDTWSSVDSGTNSLVQALATYDDGGGLALYVGGSFDMASGVTHNRIAKWTGSAWEALGTGMNNSVSALTVFDDSSGAALFVGGDFSTAGGDSANRIAKWNGSAWTVLGSGLNNTVYALAAAQAASAIGPALYVGGNFTTAGGASALRIAKWNGSSWSALTAEGMNDRVLALAVFDDGGGPALYAGGKFTSAGGVAVSYVAKWNGASWSPLAEGVDGFVHALCVFDDGDGPALYAGGEFTTAGTESANHIAKWDGLAWSALDQGTNVAVDALGPAQGDSPIGPGLYVGGSFTQAGGASAASIAEWTGCISTVIGDFDGDGDVDLNDFAIFAQCFAGADNPPAVDCPLGVDADLDGDGDVDLDDFAIFAQNFTGSL